MWFSRLGAFVVALLVCVALSRTAAAHCDTTKGPVVTAAHAALEGGDVNLVLHWVRAEDEAAVAHDDPHAAVHQPRSHAESGATADTHGSAVHPYAPWILAGLLAIAALVEGAFLVRRGRLAAA